MADLVAYADPSWNEVALTLLREIKRLEVLDMEQGKSTDRNAHIERIHTDVTAATSHDRDLTFIIQSLDQWAQQHDTSIADEATGIAAMNSQLLHQLRTTSKEEWVEAMAEGESARA